jgi:hypothetical protein
MWPKEKPVRPRNRRKTLAGASGPPRFPGESAKYRVARNTLLKSEIALRRQLEAVAAGRAGLALKLRYVRRGVP